MARKRTQPVASEPTVPYRVVVPVASYRRFPDPIHPGLYHHTGFIPALCYPDAGFPNHENIRKPNIDRQIYREIADSLKNIDCTPNLYHLKSKGELHVATQIRELGSEEAEQWFEENIRPYVPDDAAFAEFGRKYKLVEVLYEDKGASIIDGGHTDSIWKDPENRAAVRASYTVENGGGPGKNLNHLAVEWLVGIKPEWLSEIVGGRNTGLQVQDKTLANHEGKFEWIKKVVDGTPYHDLIAYRENELRSVKPIDIRDLVALMAPYNRDLFSLQDESGKRQPLIAFTSKKLVLDAYINDMEDKPDPEGKDTARAAKSFPKLAPIVRDIFHLYDLIHLEAVPQYNQKTGGRGGRLNFVDHRDTNKGEREHTFLFSGRSGPDRLADGALYPILGAFSALVTTGPDGRFAWRTPGGFEGVKKVWRAVAGSFMEATADLNKQLGYNPAAVGKSAYHWKNLYRDVAFQALS